MTTDSATDHGTATLSSPEPAEVCDVESPPWHGQPWALAPGAALGQTFRARHNGLCAVEVLLAIQTSADGELTCHVHRDSPDGARLCTHHLPLIEARTQRYARFVMPPVPDSANNRFYIWFETSAPGIALYTTGAARLSSGTAYRDHEPVDGCLVFRTFVPAADARMEELRQIQALLAARAELTRELLTARTTIRQLQDERATLHNRLTHLLLHLAAPIEHRSTEVSDRA